MTKAIKIANKIKKITKLDVFENTRKIEIVEVRSLLAFILYKYEKMKLQEIAKFFQSQGKTSSHSSVLHAVNNFETNAQYNKKIGDWLTYLTKTSKDLNYDAKREFVKFKANHLNDENINIMINIIDQLEQKKLINKI
jgi:hypothetical protein|tara:strand:- start:2509 stop:2922 length:414 start_codon:yes stop_codon:yes gene_type:complete